MNNTTYIEDWNNRHNEFGQQRNVVDEERAIVEAKLIPELLPFLKWIGILLIVGGLGFYAYGYIAVITIKWLGLLSAGLGAIPLLVFIVKNWDIFKNNRATRNELEIIDQKLTKLAKDEWTAKHGLSFEYAQETLKEITHDGNFKSRHSHQVIVFADIYEDEEYEDSDGDITYDSVFIETVMYSVNDVKVPINLGSNQYLANYQPIDTFFLDSIVDENEYQTINAIPRVDWGVFDVSVVAKKMNNGSLHVSEPFKKSKKRKWNKNYPELIGEYWPKVLGGEPQDLFGYFTPRRIDFFLNDENASMIHEIQGNNFSISNSHLSVDYLHIKEDWGRVSPEEIINRVKEYAGPFCLARYDMVKHKKITGPLLDIFK